MAFGSRGIAAGSLLLLCAHAAIGAMSVQYTVVPLGGNLYRYVYSITNTATSGGSAIQLFSILFDTSLYEESSLQIVTPDPLHSQWDERLFASAPDVPADYDALSLTGGIQPGATVTGFSVQFRWLGTGLPGAQPFQVFDYPGTPTLLQSGTSVVNPAGIPTASTLSLSILGLGLSISAALQMRDRRLV